MHFSLAGFVVVLTIAFILLKVALLKIDIMATTFAFLVLPEIHLMDLAGPDQTIHEAIEYGAPFEIEY